MKAAQHPTPRLPDAKLMLIDAFGNVRHAPRERFADFLCAGDLLVANDAATLPARQAASSSATLLMPSSSFSAFTFLGPTPGI